jgi:hypothetical protein
MVAMLLVRLEAPRPRVAKRAATREGRAEQMLTKELQLLHLPRGSNLPAAEGFKAKEGQEQGRVRRQQRRSLERVEQEAVTVVMRRRASGMARREIGRRW